MVEFHWLLGSIPPSAAGKSTYLVGHRPLQGNRGEVIRELGTFPAAMDILGSCSTFERPPWGAESEGTRERVLSMSSIFPHSLDSR